MKAALPRRAKELEPELAEEEAAAVAQLERLQARAQKHERRGRAQPMRSREFAPPESKCAALRWPKQRALAPQLARARERKRSALE